MTQLALAFLQNEGLDALHRLASGQLAYDRFRELAIAEQATRVEAATTARLATEAEKRTRRLAMQEKANRAIKQAEAARLARERDPKYVARIKQRELRAHYGIDSYVDQERFRRLMAILNRVDTGQRLSEEDFVWLVFGRRRLLHRQIASRLSPTGSGLLRRRIRRTADPWAAVNASAHYRKCDRPDEAESLLKTISVEKQKSLKLRYALCTTHGGVMRDLGRWNEALRLAQAHAFKPDDYRPCTLQGAVYMETGDYNRGQEWYAKAVERRRF